MHEEECLFLKTVWFSIKWNVSWTGPKKVTSSKRVVNANLFGHHSSGLIFGQTAITNGKNESTT